MLVGMSPWLGLLYLKLDLITGLPRWLKSNLYVFQFKQGLGLALWSMDRAAF